MSNRSIVLSKREKEVLLAISAGESLPYSESISRAVIRSLEDKGLVQDLNTKDGAGGLLTPEGRLYLTDNPKLLNPINWDSIRSWIAIIIALLALISQIAERLIEYRQ